MQSISKCFLKDTIWKLVRREHGWASLVQRNQSGYPIPVGERGLRGNQSVLSDSLVTSAMGTGRIYFQSQGDLMMVIN